MRGKKEAGRYKKKLVQKEKNKYFKERRRKGRKGGNKEAGKDVRKLMGGLKGKEKMFRKDEWKKQRGKI